MTKAELVGLIAQKTGVEKSTVMAIVETTMEEIKFSIKENESVFLRGFGTFNAKKEQKKLVETLKKIQPLSYLLIILHHSSLQSHLLMR